ncbi:MAG: type II toxin-antitoxin system RelE/ParE family toxin [Bacteroidales bacterium]|nr:type II toxin-antitoxin system RelE/ParE family toxin [Bacteroidales bacterium]
MIERKIIAYKSYYKDFMTTLTDEVRKKIHYGLDLLASQERVSKKFVSFVREGLYELRTEYESNIYRIFFIFDEGRIVVLFNGFRKKTQNIPESEIDKALKIKEEYHASKK